MKIIRESLYIRLLKYRREPASFVLLTLLPTTFYVFFALQTELSAAVATRYMASYAAFAVVNVALFQLGSDLGELGFNNWERYLQTLPTPAWPRITAKVLEGLIIAAFACLAVVVAALLLTPVTMPLRNWLQLLASLLLGGVPFVVLGGYLTTVLGPKNVAPVTNIIFLLMSYVGGLWTGGVSNLPEPVQKLSVLVPTRHYSDLVNAAATGTQLRTESVLWLLGFSAVFTLLWVQSFQNRRQRIFS